MDLTIKSKSWAGNIYHQFESICQDVDDLMGKDTVRFVENQVQSVGISVKRFYSNVVQDILPHSEDVAERESQLADSEHADICDQVKSITGIASEPTAVTDKQFSENQGSVDMIRSSDASLPVEVDSSGVNENITRVSVPVAVNINSDGEILTATSDEDHKNSTGITHEERSITAATEEENKGLLDEDPNSDENGNLTVASAHKTKKDNGSTIYSSDSSAWDAAHRALGNDGTVFDIPCKDETFDVLSSVHSPKHAFADNSYKTFNPDFTAAYETKGVDVLPDYLIFESNDFVGGFSEQRYKDGQSEIEMSRPSETGTVDEFVVGIGDLNMETVDLSPDVKHDEASAILNDNFVYAASHRRRDFRYYKKLIKDVLTSRKRLSKEYEHLAILYGDIDSESSQHFEPNPLPSSPNTSVHAVRTQPLHEMSESEWELV